MVVPTPRPVGGFGRSIFGQALLNYDGSDQIDQCGWDSIMLMNMQSFLDSSGRNPPGGYTYIRSLTRGTSPSLRNFPVFWSDVLNLF